MIKKEKWAKWYVTVVLFLALQIFLYYLFTQYWS